MRRFLDENGTTHTMTEVTDGNPKGYNATRAAAWSGLGLAVANTVGLVGGSNNGCGNGGLLGNLFNNGGGQCYETVSGSNLKLQLANADSRNYTDTVGLELFKELNRADINTYFALDAKIEKEREARRVAEKEQQAFNVDMLLKFAEQGKDIALNKQAGEYQFLLTKKDIDCVAKQAAYDTNSLACQVKATYVPGELVMPLSSICPAAMPACGTTSFNGLTQTA